MQHSFYAGRALLTLLTLTLAMPLLAHDDDAHEKAHEDKSGQDSNASPLKLPGSFSGHLRVATDYVYRGFTNTDGGPQLQGDITWAFENGFYTGFWASNTDFGGQGSTMEFDPFVGYASQIGQSAFSYNVGYWAYFYPRANFDTDGDGSTENADIDYGEVFLIGTWTQGGLSVSPSIWYADDYSGDDFLPDTRGVSYELHTSFALPSEWLNGWLRGVSISGIYGKQTFDENSGVPDIDYTFYDAGVSWTVEQFTLDIRWHDTDGVSPLFLPSDLVGPRWVAALTRSF